MFNRAEDPNRPNYPDRPQWLTSMILPIDRKLEAYHDILSVQSKFDSKLSSNLFRKLVQTSNSL